MKTQLTVGWFRRGVRGGLLLTAVALLGGSATAGLPEPGVRLYGTVAIDGVVVTAADSGVVIEARRTPTGQPVASYRMGSDPKAGNFYSLKLNAETVAPLANPDNLILGSSLYLVVRDDFGERDIKSYNFSARGQSVRVNFGAVDTDGDGMSDEFELANFGDATGGDPNADLDGDGRPNLREFLQGTDPAVADGRHPADLNPADDRLSLTEVTDYILAWKTGGTWPVEPELTATNIVDYVTRAGALWQGGETYVFDNDPATNAPLWWVNVPVGGGAGGVGGGLVAAPAPGLRAERTLPASYLVNEPVPVTVTVTPSATTRAFAVVETPPVGWTVRNLSHEGRWDDVSRQVKWGPFFDHVERTLTYQAVPPPTASGRGEFSGRGSFDGFGFAPAGPQRVWPPGQTPAPRLAAVTGTGQAGVTLQLEGEPGRRYEVESSDRLGNWVAGETVQLDPDGRASVTPGNGDRMRFFRLRSRE